LFFAQLLALTDVETFLMALVWILLENSIEPDCNIIQTQIDRGITCRRVGNMVEAIRLISKEKTLFAIAVGCNSKEIDKTAAVLRKVTTAPIVIYHNGKADKHTAKGTFNYVWLLSKVWVRRYRF
jgi:hypothetical protein